MPNYSLKREGQFSVRTRGKYHCGTKEVLTAKYRLIATCPASALDIRGFLFDQTRIHDWFTDMQTTDLSCELLARYAARELYKLIRRENSGMAPSRLTLALSPEPFMAEIEYQWDGALEAAEGGLLMPIEERVLVGPSTLRGEQCGLGLEWGGLFS